MKKIYFMAMLLCTGFAFTSCSEDNEEENNTITVDFEGDYFTKLVDTPEAYGPLLYSDDTQYVWVDANTTLSGCVTEGTSYYTGEIEYKFWNGGVAISNYVNANAKTSDNQLSVPVSNGSKNFAVVYCSSMIGGTNPVLNFTDGTARQLKSVQICPTSFALYTIQNGDSYSKALTEKGDYLTVILTADNGASVSYDLARDGVFATTWKTVDLSSLGKVKSLTLSMDTNDKSMYYINSPVYFAFDNLTIEK